MPDNINDTAKRACRATRYPPRLPYNQESVDPPASHKSGPYLLNVLRTLDIPEALGLLAPTPLTLVDAKDGAFKCTAQIYRLAAAAKAFKRE